MTPRRPARDALIRDAGPYVVVSCSDGTLRIEPGYGLPTPGRFPIYGAANRIALAARIARVLNSYTRRTP